MEELRRSLARVKRVRRKIQREFAGLDDSVVGQFLGEFDSPELRQQVREHGDGHFLFPLPSSVKQLTSVDAGVLLAMTSPKLGRGSNFKPTTPIHRIPYWRGRVKPLVHSKRSGREYRLHLMVWQQNYVIHGTDDRHASNNRRLILEHRPMLRSLFQQAEEASIELVKSFRNWLWNEGKPMVVITHQGRTRFNEPVSNLISDPFVVAIKAQLWGKYWGNNFKIMDLIGERLP